MCLAACEILKTMKMGLLENGGYIPKHSLKCQYLYRPITFSVNIGFQYRQDWPQYHLNYRVIILYRYDIADIFGIGQYIIYETMIPSDIQMFSSCQERKTYLTKNDK